MTPRSSDTILERMMSLHPKVIDLTLDRMWGLLDKLGNPHELIPPVIQIAGTNGKGSVQAMMRAGLEGAGHSVHAYTSPHLARFHERIRLAGELISEDALSDVLDECEAVNGGENITYFEITTCAAFLAFARTPADYALLEVGLGGRLDATNVVAKPALTAITPISIDHTQFLGETVPEIAGEKAGILKRGVSCIVGPQPDAALEVIEAQAARVGAPLLIHGQHWHVWEERGRLVFQDETGLLDLPMPQLLGQHQIYNGGIAVAGLRYLGQPEVAAETALTNVEWPARMQRLKQGPLIEVAGAAELWLDGGHNPAAGLAIASALQDLPKRPLHLICGMLAVKDIEGFLRPLAPLAERLHAVDIPDQTATAPAADTRDAAEAVGFDAQIAASVKDAIAAITAETPDCRILICGSLYLAGHILQTIG